METRTIRITLEAYKALAIMQEKSDQRSRCYLASAVILKSTGKNFNVEQARGNDLPAVTHEENAVVEFHAFYKEFKAVAGEETKMPSLDQQALSGLFGRQINTCYKITGGFSVFFRQLSASPYLVQNGTLDHLLKPEIYRRVCAGGYGPRVQDATSCGNNGDILSYQLDKDGVETWGL